jgi:hypothetical protein
LYALILQRISIKLTYSIKKLYRTNTVSLGIFTMMWMTPLQSAPASLVDPMGRPVMGRFQGLAKGFDWHRLAAPFARSALWRRFHHKRWHYVALSTPEVFCGIAVVDVGWTNTAFAYVFDRNSRQVAGAWSQDGLPGLTATLADHAEGESVFRFPGKTIRLSARGLSVRGGGMAIEAVFSGASPVLLAVGRPEGGAVHATQKSGALACRGEVRVRGQAWPLEGGCASYDYSNGLLARDTAWRWASAHAPGLGFNLQAGYFGSNENALWLDGELVALGAARFEYDPANPLADWRVSTGDGLLELVFTPEGARREDKDLVVAASRYIQPIGVFNGWVRPHPDRPKVAVTGLAGVTEDHHSRW